MEFLKTYIMAAVPVLIAFIAIWWFMTICVLASSIRSASRCHDVEGNRAGSKRPKTDTPHPQLRDAA